MTADISFGRWLRQRRRMLDLTQQAFADLVGCARSTLRRIEADDLKPSKALALIFLEKLNIPETERPEWIRFARGLSTIPQKSIQQFIPFRRSTNLPTALTTFIGRENEQAQITSLIAKHRLVTLIGPGGVGKTRLALQVCQKLIDDYSGGIWFIALDSLSDPALVPQTVAFIFDIRELPDRPIIDTLIDSLREKTALLLLDNCEHLLDACAHLVMSLLTNCPNLKILATSRETLGLEGGVTYHTPSLSIPEDRKVEPANQLTQNESVQLFVERAALTIPSFNLTNEKTTTIANICRRLDGIPLAIELAAARVDILQAHEILEQLNHCLDLLVNQNRITLTRHQTMRASMDWSWGLLTISEQTFMRQLSVFAGGWTLEASQVVCEGDVLNLTSALAKKSLIVVNQETGRETRYRFHEMVRQYAHEKLVETGDEESVRTRHLKYFLQFCEQAASALKGPAQMDWHAQLRTERDNIRAALEQADQTDTESGLYLCSRLGDFEMAFDLPEVMRWVTRFLEKPESRLYPHARAGALHTLAWSLQWQQQFERAYTTAQECLDLYKTCGDQYGEVDALTLVGTLSYWQVASDMALLKQALAQAKSLGDRARQARILCWMGQLVGNVPQRVTYWEKAITLFRREGDIYATAGFMIHLAHHDMLYGNFESARARLDTALVLNQQKSLGAERHPHFLSIYGRMCSIHGDYRQARACLQAAISIAEDRGHRMDVLWIRTNLGYLALREGNIAEARRIFMETARNFQKDENIEGVAFTLEGMAGVCVEMDQPATAARLTGWSDAARRAVGSTRPPLEQADVDKVIAACLAKMGEVAFSDAYDEGQRMTVDEAVALALEE